MPHPQKGEEKDAFIGRCVSELMKEEGREQKQALAICFSYWEKKDEGKVTVIDKIDKLLTEEGKHTCSQCGKDMGNEWILGPVCGKCVRKNHAKVTGRRLKESDDLTLDDLKQLPHSTLVMIAKAHGITPHVPWDEYEVDDIAEIIADRIGEDPVGWKLLRQYL